MRITLIVCLILISAALSAAQVSLDCDGTPVETVIADIARQSGRKITLAAPTDVKVTAGLTNASVDEALKLVSGLCGGTFVKTGSGYRVYPKSSPEHVLGLVRGMYSKIRDIDLLVKYKANPNSAGVETLISHSIWKSTGLSREEIEYISGDKLAKTVIVEDGQWRWLSRFDSCHIERFKPTETSGLSVVTATSHRALPFLADCDPFKFPNLICSGAELRNGRAVYVMEYDPMPPPETYKTRETGPWAPPPGRPGMQPASPIFRLSAEGMAMEFGFSRPSARFDPPVVRRPRFGVDGDTGVVVFVTADTEVSDIREVAPGVYLPFEYKRDRDSLSDEAPPEVEVRVNQGVDDSLFKYTPPPGGFVVSYPVDQEACEAALKEKPDDPDLLYTRAQYTAGRDTKSNAAALRDYECALTSRPESRPCLLLRMLNLASDAESPDAALKYISEVRKSMPDSRDAAFAIARAYRNIGMDSEALKEFVKLCASIEKRSEAPLNEMAALCEKAGDKAHAERLYLEVLSVGDANQCEQAVSSLYTMHSPENCLDALREPLKAATDRLPESSGLLLRYGQLLSKLGEPDAAMDVYRQLAKSNSSGPVAQVIRDLKSARNYKGVKEIAGIYLSQPSQPSKPSWRWEFRDRGLIFVELIGIYTEEGMTVSRAIEVYREFMASESTEWSASSARRTMRSFFTQAKAVTEALQTVHKLWKADRTDTNLANLLIELATPGYNGAEDADTAVCAAAVRDLIAFRPDEPGLNAILGEVLLRAGDYPEAAKAFIRGRELAPDDPYYYTALANVYSRAKEHDKALDLLRRLLERAPANDYFYTALGVGHANAGEWKDAVIQFRKADELQQAQPRQYPSNTLNALIRCYERLGDMSSIEQCLMQKVERATVDSQRKSAVKALAEFQAKNGDIGRCIASIIQIEEMSSEQAPQYSTPNISHSVSKERLKELVDALASALAGKPDLFYCRLFLAEWYTQLQDASSATAIYNALAIRAWDDPVQLSRVCQSLVGNEPLARVSMQILERLVSLEPNKMWHSVSLMTTYGDLGMKDKAVALGQKLMRYVRGGVPLPEDADITLAQLAQSVGSAFSGLGTTREALEAYELAIHWNPDGADDYRFGMAIIYERGGDLDAALAEYSSIVSISKSDSRKISALRQSAMIYERRKQNDEAVKCWRRIRTLSDDEYAGKEAQTRIERLTAPPPPAGNSAPVPGQ